MSSRRRPPLTLEVLEDRALLSAANAQLIPASGLVNGQTDAPGEEDYFAFTLPAGGQFTAQVVAGSPAATPQLALFTADEGEIVRSDGLVNAPAARIEQYLDPGSYFLRVSSLDALSYALTTDFATALPPFTDFPTGSFITNQIVSGDLNNDDVPDLVVANSFIIVNEPQGVTVFLGNGDGSFQPGRALFSNRQFSAVVLGDFDGDRRLDLAAVEGFISTDLRLFQGLGDGSFIPFPGAASFRVSRGVPVAADFDQNGTADLVIANPNSESVDLLLSNGDGTFRTQTVIEDARPQVLRVADLNRDGWLDVVSAETQGDRLIVALNKGDGSFRRPRRLDVPGDPVALTVGDLDGDNRPDLVVGTATVRAVRAALFVFPGVGDGTFQRPLRYAPNGPPTSLTVGDFNRDNRPDLVQTSFSAGVSLFLGAGRGRLLAPRLVASSGTVRGVVAADFDADGVLDLAATDLRGGAVAVLEGNGDGTFLSQRVFATGQRPGKVVAGFVDQDRQLDLIIVNDFSNDVSVLLGTGDGSFRSQRRFQVGINPVDVAVADLNRDGRPDLITANQGEILSPETSSVSILLGTGDGTFRLDQTILVPERPSFATTADLDNDGLLDILVATFAATLTVLRGQPNGSFQLDLLQDAFTSQVFVLADATGDGIPDLIRGTNFPSAVTVQAGNGAGSFDPLESYPLPFTALALAVADLNRDNRPDVVAVGGILIPNGTAAVLLGQPDGRLQRLPQDFLIGVTPSGAVVGDFDGDGIPDLATANSAERSVSVLLGNGDGTLRQASTESVGRVPSSLAVADLNGDGHLDLVVANEFSNDVTVLLGDGRGDFGLLTPDRAAERRHVPLRGDLDGDGVSDTVILNNDGEILFRRGLPGPDNLFESPRVLNRTPANPARDLAFVTTAAGLAVAASDAAGNTVSLYRFEASPTRTVLDVDPLPQRLLAADLDGNGLDDLVVSCAQTLVFLFQNADGSFRRAVRPALGVAPADLEAVDVDGRDGLDVVIAHRSSGDIGVLYNDASRSFTRTARYRAGTALSGSQTVLGRFQPLAANEPVSLVSGEFNGDRRRDLLIVDRNTHRLWTLPGSSSGGFTNPSLDLSVSTSVGLRINERPGAAETADFDGDGHLDIAVVMEDRGEVWVYRGDGAGGFALSTTMQAGAEPTGLSLAQLNDDNGDGRIDADDFTDLVVGNGVGDILFILGDGAGRFRSFVRADQRIPFVATDLNGDGRLDVVLANQGRDVAQSRLRSGGSFTPGAFRRDRDNGLIGPGDVALADLDGRFGSDLIFANTGSNNVLVYLRTADGSFASKPRSFFVGTNPVDLRVAQLSDDNGDGKVNRRDVPDLAVANEGSNDVSILFGSRALNSGWTFRPGPRLQVDGFAPRFVSARDVNRDGVLDIIATSGPGGQTTVLPGVGAGFFNDVAPQVLNLGGNVTDMQGAFALLDNGAVVQFDFLSDTVTTLFTSARGGTALQVMALPGLRFPLLFVGNGDGTVSGLMSSDGLTYTETALRGDFDLDNPSALQVLQGGNNQLEVYVSDAGENGLVVLRFGVEELTAGLVSLDGGASLALVAALTSTTVPNSLLIDVLLDEVPTVVEVGELFAAEEFTGTLSAVGERVESVGEQVLSALTAAEGVPAGLVGDAVEPPQGLRELILGVEEGLKRFAQPSEPQVPPAADPKEKQKMPESPSVPETPEGADGAGESAGPTSGVDSDPEDALTPLLTAAFFVAGLQTMRPRRGRSTRLHGDPARR